MIAKPALVLSCILATSAVAFTNAFTQHNSRFIGRQKNVSLKHPLAIPQAQDSASALCLSISRKEHEDRNQFNELPKGKIKPSPEDPTMWKDEAGRPWKLNGESNAVYHQPYPVPVAFVRTYIGILIPPLKVKNLKFISPNADGRYSEIVADRYTGELVIEQQILGTFNFATDAPDAMKDGKLPTTGEHDELDVIPHNEYGGGYRHIAKGIKVGSIEKGPVILAKLERETVITQMFM